MNETVVENKDMLCSCIVNESNFNSIFLKTKTHPICSCEAFISLSNGIWDEFPNIVTNMISG